MFKSTEASRLSLNLSRQSLVPGSKCRRRSLTKASANGVVALNAWYTQRGPYRTLN